LTDINYSEPPAGDIAVKMRVMLVAGQGRISWAGGWAGKPWNLCISQIWPLLYFDDYHYAKSEELITRENALPPSCENDSPCTAHL